MLLKRILHTSLALTTAIAATLASLANPTHAQAAEEGQRQLLFYNHAYSVVDRETADAVENSAYLREFANFEVRNTTGGGITWKGRYLKGRETYVELFAEGDLPGQDAEFGSAGMAVSTEHVGDLATVTERLQDKGITPVPYRQTRDFGDGVPVPWFDTIRTFSEPYDAFDGWSMEYCQEYFADPRSNTEPESYPGDVSRERYLPDAYQDHLMRDITNIRIGVTERDLANTVPLLKAGGFNVKPVAKGIVASGAGTTIRLDSVPRERAGIRQIDFALNQPVSAQHKEQIGRSTLTVGPGARAVWTFDPKE